MILSTAKLDGVWYATVTDENGGLVTCSFSYSSEKAAEKSVIQSLPEGARHDLTRSPSESSVIEVLRRIHAGRDTDLPREIIFTTASKFLRKVYKTTMRIPKGKVATYGGLAKLAGSERASRAVGNAMARNPLPLVVPCHRVVRSTLQVGNYGSERNGRSRTKRELLAREGVRFDGEKISKKSIWAPP